MKFHGTAFFKQLAICAAAAIAAVPLTGSATPAYNWDLQTYYPYAEALPTALTSQQAASITQFDGYYPLTVTNPNGTGLTTSELNEVLAMPAYFNLDRNPTTGVLTGRGIVVDDESTPAQPDLSKPASFNGDFVTAMIRLTDLYANATTAQASQLEQVHSDLIEHFLDQNYLPGGKTLGTLPLGNGYTWTSRGWKTLRMMHKISTDKRDLYALSLAYVAGFSELMKDDVHSSTDIYYNYFNAANKSLALMSDTPAKWQLMKLIRRGMDISIIGKEENPTGGQLVPLDGSIIHHTGHAAHYGIYSYAGMLQMHVNWTTAGFTSAYTAKAIDRLRKGSLAWCFATTGGLNPLHQMMEGNLPSANSPSDGGAGNGADFALKAANLTSAYYGTPIANDLEMAYAAIAKTGVGSTALPTQWRTITPPANIDPNSPLYTASLQGHYSHTTNGTSIQRGPGQWYATVRGQPTHWRGGEARYGMGLPEHFNLKSMHSSLMLITTGKNGRKPNEADSGYRYEGWNYSYFPNVTCPDYAPGDLLYWSVWAYFAGESNLMGSANLRESGVWMAKGAACKSAFFLGNRIVTVTNNVSGNGLHTGLLQLAHETPAAEPLVLDGTSYTADGNWSLAAGGNHKIVDPKGNAYFVHAVAGTPEIKARRGNQDWTYSLPEKWTGTGTAPTFTYRDDFLARSNEFTPTTANYSRVWFDHGASTSNQALEYTVLVKPNAGDLDTYAANMAGATPPVTVTKTAKVHRYCDRATGTNAVAVFDASETLQIGDLVSVNRPGAYIWRNDNDLMRLSVSSSETENTTAFQINLTGSWVIDSQTDTYYATATSSSGTTVVSLSYRQAAPQNLVLRRAGNNSTPTWTSASITKADAIIATAYSSSVAGDAGDVDAGDTRTFSKYSGPAWLNVAANGALSGTPAGTDFGSYTFIIRVTDALGSFSDVTLNIAITHVNDAPVFAVDPIMGQDAHIGVAYAATLAGAATDINTGDTLSYLKVSGPAWLSIAANGTLSGTPAAGDAGFNRFLVRVTDAGGLFSQATLNITVTVLPNNGTWTNAAGGSWTSLGNWSGNLIAGGVDKTADFSTLNLTANATVTLDGATTVGTLKFGDTTPSHNWTLNTGSGGPLTLAVSAGTPAINVVNQSATINAVLAGNQGFTKTGTGTLALTGANIYTGVTTVSSGIVNISGDQSAATGGWSLNSTNITVNFQSGSTIEMGVGKTIAFGSGTASNTRILNVAGTVTTSTTSNLTVQGGSTINLNSGANWTQNGSLTIQPNSTFTSSLVTVNSGASFTYEGASTITLANSSGTNGGNGTLNLSGGTFTTGKGFNNGSTGTAGTATLNFSGGGTLKLSAYFAPLATNTGGKPFNVQIGNGGGKIDTNGFASTLTQGIVNMTGQTGTLTKTGLGTLTLSGASTYTGATMIEGGTLDVTGSLGNSAVIVINGATLAGNGAIAGTVTNNGTLAPVSNGFGNLTVNNTLTLAGASAIEWEIADWTGTAGAGYDKLTSTSLIITATSANPVIIRPVDLALTHFTETDASFVLVQTTAGITGFSAGKFAVDDSGLTLPQGTWEVQQSGNNLVLVYTRSNTDPVFTADPIVASSTEDVVFSGSIIANDPDAAETLVYTKLSGPTWLTVATNGALSGTPDNGDVGINTANVRVTDSRGATAEATLQITVANVNDAPVFTSNPINKPAATEDITYSGTLVGSATDVDEGETLTYSKVSGPAWLSVAANGALSGTPTNGDVDASSFTVRVTDAVGVDATATLNISVANVNDAPTFTEDPINGADANAGVAYAATLAGAATDVDAGDTLSYSKVSGPAWLSLAEDGTLSGTPAVGDSGNTNSFTVRVTDAGGLSSQATLNITVTVLFGNGIWTNAAGGTWTSASNWNGGVIASGVDKAADFSTLNLTADATVSLDGANTVGSLTFGDTTPGNNWTLNAGSGGPLMLAVSSGTPAINVANQSATISAVLEGSQGMQKTGSGGLTLAGANTYSGVTTIIDGSGLVTVSGNQSSANGGWLIGANSSAATTVTFAAGSQVNVATGKLLRIGNTGASGTFSQTLNVAGTVINPGQLIVGRPAILNLNAGGLWTQSGTMSVTGQGGYTAKLNVNSGSSFTYTGSSTIKVNGAQGSGGQALVAIDGILTTSAGFEQTTVPTTGFGRVTLQNGGTIRLSANIPALSTAVQLALGTNGGAIDTNGFAATLGTGITGSSALAKRGRGVLTLSGANTYSGATIIESGTLDLTGSLGGSAVEIKSAATLTLGGNTGGAVTVRSNGHLAFALAASSDSQVSRSVGGALVFDSGSVLDLTAATTPQPGDYILATAQSITGAPATVVLPPGITGSVFVVGTSLHLVSPAASFPLISPAGDTDSDGDGLPDMVESVLGTDPGTATPSGIQSQIADGQLVLIFPRTDASEAMGLQLAVEASDDLQSWPQIYQIGATTGTSSPGVSIAENGEEADTVTVAIPTHGSSGFFTRLKVTGDRP